MTSALRELGRAFASARADGGTRLVVFAQRRPWTTSVVVGAAAAVCLAHAQTAAVLRQIPWEGTNRVYFGVQIVPHLARVTPLVASVACCASLPGAGRGRGPWHVLPPWLGACVAAIGGALALGATSAAGVDWSEFADLLAVTTTLAFIPMLAARPAGRLTPRAAAAIAAAALALFTAAPWLAAGAGVWYFSNPCVRRTGVVVALVTVAFHAVVRTTWRTRSVLAAAPVVGVAAATSHRFGDDRWMPAFGTTGYATFSLPTWRAEDAIVLAVVSTFAALLIVAARRCRSMTAVPRDHPVVADFGGE